MANYSEEEKRVLTKEMSDKIYNDSYSITEEELVQDTNWIEASKDVYKELEGVDWSGTDEDLAKKGLDMMSRFNYNLTLGTINYTAQLQDASDKTKLSFYYMMDMYDKKDISLNGTMRAFKELGLDPASYIGIGTLGMGFAGKQATAVAAKKGLKEMLKQGAIKILQSPVAVASTEGAIYTAADDIARQDAAIGAQIQDKYNPTQTGVAAGIGAVAGAGIVKGTQFAGRKINQVMQEGNELMMQQAGGGTPPKISTNRVDMVLNEAKDLQGNAMIKHLNKLNMKELSPEDKQKVIEFRKANIQTKPKTEKVEEKILARDQFQKGFYSKLEDTVLKLPDDMKFNTIDEAIEHLKKQGVKQDEIDAAGLNNNMTSAWTDINKADLENALNSRTDIIQKESIVDLSEDGGVQDFDTWESEWVYERESDRVSVGESGWGKVITDERTGREIEIGQSYNDDVYVDDYGTEYDWSEMRDDWYDNYADPQDYMDRLIDDGIDLEDEDAIKDAILEYADDDAPWYDYYGSKVVYENEFGQTYDDLDEAIEATKREMYDEYEAYADEYGKETYADYTVDGGDNYDMEVYRMPDFEAMAGKQTHQEPHLGDYEDTAENVAFHVRKKDRTDADGNTGVVLEEVQSQWEQDWRSQGGGNVLSAEEKTKVQSTVDDLLKKEKDLIEQRTELSNKRRELKAQAENITTTEENDFKYTPEQSKLLSDLEKQIDEIVEKEADFRLKITENRTAQENEMAKLKGPDLATPPLSKRTQYEKLALMDQLKNAIDKDMNYFGFINGHIQNGGKIKTTKGMVQAYDVEMPRIIQKLTNQKPYMAKFYGGRPVSGEKIYWDPKKAAEGDYYDNISSEKNNGEFWYWRVDLTPELKDKITKSKIQLYTNPATVGTAAAGAAAATQQEETNND